MIDQEMTPQEIKDQKPYLEWGLTEKEYDYICDHLIHRLPNYTETGLFAVMWSEHCSYKKSKPLLKLFPNKNERVLQGPGEGAGIVDIGDDQAVVFKAESHNHPSAVEPYEGAATGVGGILRDIFSMGARPIASLDSLHFGEINNAHTRYLINEVVAGIGGYGNCMGIPTVAGETTFDECYEGNPLVNAMSVGLMNKKDIQKGRASGEGNLIMYVGAKTGRDGIHGATFASTDFDSEHETQRSAVQVGDPFMEKLLMEACLELIQKHADWLVGIQDMGAAGLVSSSCEMASKANSGVKMNLDLVPQRESGMSAYEIMLSESQERMLLCVKKGNQEDVRQLFEKYNLDVVVIGEVTSDHQYVLTHHDQIVTDIPVSSLTDDVLQEKCPERQPERLTHLKANSLPQIDDPAQTLIDLLQQPTVASKKVLTQTYDSQVRASTVAGPNATNDAGVIRVRGTQKGLAMTTDGNGRFGYLNPRVGGQIAVLEAAANVIAKGAQPLAITDCLNFGDPNDPEVYWELHQSIAGMAELCRKLNTPVISGNVSLYNENNGQAIYPTPMVGMVGLISNVDHAVSNHITQDENLVYVVGQTADDYSGSELQKMLTGKIDGKVNEFDYHQAVSALQKALTAMQDQLVTAAHDVSEGGLGVTLAEMIFDTSLGMDVEMNDQANRLFSETPGRIVLTVKPADQAAFEKVLGNDATLIGKTTATHELRVKTTDAEFKLNGTQLQRQWEDAIPCLMKSKD